MKNTFNDDRVEQAGRAARLCAIEAAKNVFIDVPAILAATVPDCFGAKWQDKVTRIREYLDDTYYAGLYLYAAKSFAYAKNNGAAFLKELATNPKDWKNAGLCTPDGYADSEGWASTLYNHLECPKEADDVFNYFESLTQRQRPPSSDALEAMAVLWFYEAAGLYKKNSIVALGILYEASDAMAYATYSRGWDEAAELERSDSREKASNVARDRALAKHAPYAKAREKLITLWKTGLYKGRTECVMRELTDLIEYCGKPIAFRTAIDWLTGIDKD